MNLYEMAQSTLAEKGQWLAGETVVLFKTEHARAVLRENDYLIHLYVSACGRWGPQVLVAMLDYAHGWVPCTSFTEDRYRLWVKDTRRVLGI